MKKINLNDFVLDTKTNKTGQVLVEDSECAYVQFPQEKTLVEYSKSDNDIIKVGTEKPYSILRKIIIYSQNFRVKIWKKILTTGH